MTTARTTNHLHSKGRKCDSSYLVTPREAGVMATRGSNRLRDDQTKVLKLRQHSGQLSSPLVSSTPPKIKPFSLLEPIYDLHLRRPSLCLLSFAACRPTTLRTRARKRCIRKRARRTYQRYLETFHLPPKPHCEAQQQQPTVQLPTNVMPNDVDPRQTGNKMVYRHLNLIDIINKVEVEEKDRDRLHGLVTCAEEFKASQNKNCKCNNIISLGHGSWNCAYRLTFDNGESLAALVSNYEPKAFSKTMKESEIATMQFLHSSPKYNKHIKVPKVYSWDLSHDNKAGAPYIFREVIEGKDLSREFHTLTKEQKLRVTTAIARVHKVLSQPVEEFTQIGGIYYSREKGFHTGGYPGNWSPSRPFTSIEDLWKEKLENSRRSGLDKAGRLVKNQNDLSKLTEYFSPPGNLSRLCIQHFDLAIRNVIFNDDFEIAGVIDWEYAQVVPLAIAAKIPLDFEQDAELSDSYAAAYNDECLGTSRKDFEDSIDYISFHDLVMGPEHATTKKYVSRWVERVTTYFKYPQIHNDPPHRKGKILRFPPDLRALRRLEGEGPELAANGCS